MEEKRAELRSIIMPTVGQFSLCAILSTMLLLIVFRETIWQRFFGHIPLENPGLHKSIDNLLATLGQFKVANTAVIILFWSGVGLIAYTIVWGVLNALIEARNEVVMETAYTNRGKWQAAFYQRGMQTMLALAMFLSLAATAKLTLPFWLELFGRAVLQSSTGAGIANAVAAIGGLALNLYFLWTLVQLVFWAD